VARGGQEAALRLIRTLGCHARVLELRLHGTAIRHIPDRGDGQQLSHADQRAEADLDGELRAVLAQGEQVEAHAHRPASHALGVVATVRDVPVAEALGKQELDGLAGDLVRLMSEEQRNLVICENDVAGRVDNYHRVRCGIEHSAHEVG
jgi:hypothetical protein